MPVPSYIATHHHHQPNCSLCSLSLSLLYNYSDHSPSKSFRLDNQEMQEDSNFGASTVSFCPSFNAYSSPTLLDIADKVTQEQRSNGDVGNIEEEDFEFVSVGEAGACQLSLDGQIRQVFPVFNRDLLLNNADGDGYGDQGSDVESLLVPLRNLFMEDQDGPPSCSSSDADELEGLPEETYCVWTPNRNAVRSSSSNKCKKSNSTGSSSSSSSKAWLKIRDLLKRSNSDGKESFVFLQKPKLNAESKPKPGSSKGKSKAGKLKAVSAHEAFYAKNRADDKKKSYLPYRQDLVGVFASSYLNSLGKTFPPF